MQIKSATLVRTVTNQNAKAIASEKAVEKGVTSLL
jgi:hypothetical protein